MDGDGARRAGRLWLLPALLAAAGSHCSPTEIAEERFQSRQQTCYEFPQGVDGGPPVQDSYWSGAQRPEGCKGQLASTSAMGMGGSSGPGSSGPGSGGLASAGLISGGAGSNTVPPGQSVGGVADAGMPI